MRSTHFLKILFIYTLIWGSCGEVSKPQAMESTIQSDIVGFWELHSAKRNGRSTESLQDAHFTFEQPNFFSTNVFGTDLLQEVIWKDSTFMPMDSSMIYRVESLMEDTLQLTFDVQRYTFDLMCLRAAPNELNGESAPSMGE